ncbi:hypothetical protein AAVH_15827 [Aphelenchoides avenae]|nr:hypothetical protein AAVH_15827 [Aphelenchus avenae]
MLNKSLVDTVLKSLTGKQLVKGVKVYNNLVREFDGDIGSVIDRMATVASNNLQPLLDMMQIKVKTMTANDRTKTQCIAQEYFMANSYLTADRVKLVMTRLKAKMTDIEWAALKRSLGSVIFFDKYVV